VHNSEDCTAVTLPKNKEEHDSYKVYHYHFFSCSADNSQQ